MSDLIDRRAAIEVIDAILPVEPMKNEYTQGITCGAALAIEYVKQLTPAQPEIIRCKDCKEFRRWIDTDITFCDRTEYDVKEDDFCSRAERRTDG